ncbi:hypothetical protein [Streptomyces sp. MAI_2237]
MPSELRILSAATVCDRAAGRERAEILRRFAEGPEMAGFLCASWAR